MKQPERLTTSQQIKAILALSNPVGLGHTIKSSRVYGIPHTSLDGRPVIWGKNERPGPLDGQARMGWYFETVYNDGRRVTIHPNGKRVGEWPGNFNVK